jgi:Fe-S cluster biogenesis protein NfuA
VSDNGTALRERIEAALEEVRPGIRADGGDVWLIKVEDATAYVQMVGACGGCAMVNTTLKLAIEASVTSACPEIAHVEQI